MNRHFNGSSTHDGFSRVSDQASVPQQVNDAWILEGGHDFRVFVIVLAAVNMASAILMIGNILYDAWTVRYWDFETKRQ